MIIGWSAPHSESRRLIHGTGAAGKPVNGNPLLKAPSTVNNKPIHGAKVRLRTVVSAIAIQCSTERNCVVSSNAHPADCHPTTLLMF